jgi:hypothetical protein
MNRGGSGQDVNGGPRTGVPSAALSSLVRYVPMYVCMYVCSRAGQDDLCAMPSSSPASTRQRCWSWSGLGTQRQTFHSVSPVGERRAPGCHVVARETQ